MTEPSLPRPVPGPGQPVPGPARTAVDQPTDQSTGGSAADRFRELSERPVAEHVEVFETEHARLQAELGTIDRL